MSELLGANTDVLDRKAESLSVDARRVQDVRALAQRAMGELEASWNGPDLRHLTQQWEQTWPLLDEASASLDTCAARLRAQSAAQRLASSEDGGSPGIPMPTPMSLPASPPKRGSPAGNATWWKSLTALQQQQVIREHPEWIGNRDGVDFTARDLANRALLTVGQERLEADKKRLDAEMEQAWSGGESLLRETAPLERLEAEMKPGWSGHESLLRDSTPRDRLRDKLASIQAIRETLALGDPRQLLLLDLGQERAEAAIANGNVQTATNVAVFVPGMTTTVDKFMRAYDSQMRSLREKAEAESSQAHPTQTAATTATVTWIGYQAPQWGDVLNPSKSVANIALAEKGAAHLVPFLQGIGTARDHDAHLTLMGHSYGSTTAGLALRQETGVDDAVFFGSPGLGTSHIEDLKLAAGHAYYIEAQWDGVGDLRAFGIDPSHLDGIRHASAAESTVTDPVTGQARHFNGVTGHNSYLVDDSTSQYNMSVVVGGVPDRRVYDSGEGVGDVLSWPLPGTY